MSQSDEIWMARALELAERGRGLVEPNPMVGCVVVDDTGPLNSSHDSTRRETILSEGFHRRFGGPHAEVDALAGCDAERVACSTVYVTLEPCSHFGKTPPCVDLLLRMRPARVVVAMQDPFEQVSGRGIDTLRRAGINVTVGVLEAQARELNAPYLKLITTSLPWVIAKWAMTLDGAIATRTKDSRWISNSESRAMVHELRSRVDAVIVGIGTALADDPLLTARLPQGCLPSRIASRVVIDRNFRLPIESQLMQSLDQGALFLAVGEAVLENHSIKRREFESLGCQFFKIPQERREDAMRVVMEHLGSMRYTNVLVEGGGTVLGKCFDLGLVDQVECFICPKILGDLAATRPIAGIGPALMSQAKQLVRTSTREVAGDLHFRGFVERAVAD